jgi:hypothetical protein
MLIEIKTDEITATCRLNEKAKTSTSKFNQETRSERASLEY